MLKQITLEVHSINYGEIRLDTDGEFLHVIRPYRLLDASGKEIWKSVIDGDPVMTPDVRVLEVSIPLSDIPADVMDALIQIDNFLKDRIKQREEIS